MSISDEYRLLSNIPFFQDLESADLKRLIFCSQRYQLSENEYLFRQGEMSDMVFASIDGTYSVVIDTPDGELEISTMDGVAVIGEIGAILGDSHTASVRATSTSEVIGMESKLFLSTVTKNPDTALKTMRLLASRLKDLSIKTVAVSQTRHS